MSKNLRDNAFEKFVNDLLHTHEFNDKLRSIVKGEESLANSVDQILIESQLEAFFIEVDEVDTSEYSDTLAKLNKLKKKIFGTIPLNKKDYNILELIILKFSEGNVRLSKEILLYLNELNRNY
jgi:hypothetical protein